MRKRILSLLTAAAIVVSFTGCAPQGTTGNSSENKETQDSQTEEEETNHKNRSSLSFDGYER